MPKQWSEWRFGERPHRDPFSDLWPSELSREGLASQHPNVNAFTLYLHTKHGLAENVFLHDTIITHHPLCYGL